jgi:hypothetical protein
MDIAAEEAATRQAVRPFIRHTQFFRRSQHDTDPGRVSASTAAKIENLKATNEGFALSDAQAHERARRLIESQETTRRRHVAGVARYLVEREIPGLKAAVARIKAAAEGDVARTLPPDALHHVDVPAMVNLHLLRELRRSRLEQASAGELLQSYYRALSSSSFGPAAMVDLELVEEIVANRNGSLARDESELPTAVTLREEIASVRRARVPDLSDIEEAIAEAEKVVAHAGLIQIHPVNPAHDPAAGQAFDQAWQAFNAESARQ